MSAPSWLKEKADEGTGLHCTDFLELDFSNRGIKMVNVGRKLHRMGGHAQVDTRGGGGSFNGRRHWSAPNGGLRVGSSVVVPDQPPPSSPLIFLPIQLLKGYMDAD